MNIHTLLGWLQPPRLVQWAFRLRPRSEFLLFGGQRLTRGQVWADIRRLAAGLQGLGVRPGDRVAVLLPACPEAIYAIFLPGLLGSINVPLNPLLREPELRHILADCDASVVITRPRWYGQDYPAMLARLRPDLPALRHVIVCGAGPGEVDAAAGQIALAAVMVTGQPLRPVPIAAGDLNLLSYTSGTSGLPKGVAHTRGRTLGLLTRAVRPDLARTPLRCLLLPFAPYHFAGTFGVVSTLLAGGKVALLDRFDPRQMLETIQAERVTQIAAAPTMYRWLLRTPGQERYDLSSVRRLTFSTEPCPPDLAEALHARFGCSLQNIYGTAESMIISWTGLDDPWARAATTVGRPAPGVRVRIVDEARQPLSPGAANVGEIAVHTSQMMLGYYRDPTLTAQVLDADGWFYTGDLGWLGDDGYLRLTGRKKDMLIRGGEKVYPEEVEHALERHPAVRRAGVIGVPGPAGGDAVWAFLELHGGAQLTARAALDFARGQLAPFKVPEQVRFIERLPVTATGKVQRFRLRELAATEGE
jgi:acyl-CoA synthetase (AMP-forming)/AMP-acid ligase II